MRRIFKISKTAIAVSITSATVTGAAFAGKQFLATSGYAFSCCHAVAYRNLPQSSVDEAQTKAVLRNADFTAKHNRVTFAFSTAANRDTFLSNPDY